MGLLFSNANSSLGQIQSLPVANILGARHNPAPFSDFIDGAINKLENRGFSIVDQEWELTEKNQRFFGVLRITNDELINNNDLSFLVGLRGAHDQSFGRGITLGNMVQVCSNITYFSGDLGFGSTKQTTNINDRIYPMLDRVLDNLPKVIDITDRFFKDLKNTQVQAKIADHLLTDLARQKVLNGNEFIRAVNEWDDPKYPEHNDRGDSLWKLFNASTEAIKPTGKKINNVLIQDKSKAVYNYFENALKLAA